MINYIYDDLITDSTGQELREHGTPEFPVDAYKSKLSVRHVTWHWHSELEISWVSGGKCIIGVTGKKLEASPGNLYFVNSGVLHNYIPIKGQRCTLYSILFQGRLIGSIDSIFWQKYVQRVIEDRGLYFRVLPPDEPDQKQIFDGLLAAWKSMDAEHPGYEFTVRSALSRLIVLLGYHSSLGTVQPPEKAVRDNERMKLMIRFVQQNFAGDITIDDIAASAALSKSECIRCFHATIGTTPIAYAKNFRLHRASRELGATDRPVSEIAYECGFREMSYFSRAFKSRYGCTPSEYRASHKNEIVETPEIEEMP